VVLFRVLFCNLFHSHPSAEFCFSARLTCVHFFCRYEYFQLIKAALQNVVSGHTSAVALLDQHVLSEQAGPLREHVLHLWEARSTERASLLALIQTPQSAPLVAKYLVAVARGLLDAWLRHCADFDVGGRLAAPSEADAAALRGCPATTDLVESLFAHLKLSSRRLQNGSISTSAGQAVFKFNNTREWLMQLSLEDSDLVLGYASRALATEQREQKQQDRQQKQQRLDAAAAKLAATKQRLKKAVERRVKIKSTVGLLPSSSSLRAAVGREKTVTGRWRVLTAQWQRLRFVEHVAAADLPKKSNRGVKTAPRAFEDALGAVLDAVAAGTARVTEDAVAAQLACVPARGGTLSDSAASLLDPQRREVEDWQRAMEAALDDDEEGIVEHGHDDADAAEEEAESGDRSSAGSSGKEEKQLVDRSVGRKRKRSSAPRGRAKQSRRRGKGGGSSGSSSSGDDGEGDDSEAEGGWDSDAADDSDATGSGSRKKQQQQQQQKKRKLAHSAESSSSDEGADLAMALAQIRGQDHTAAGRARRAEQQHASIVREQQERAFAALAAPHGGSSGGGSGSGSGGGSVDMDLDPADDGSDEVCDWVSCTGCGAWRPVDAVVAAEAADQEQALCSSLSPGGSCDRPCDSCRDRDPLCCGRAGALARAGQQQHRQQQHQRADMDIEEDD
jgi:hypothetical protein